MPPDFKITHSWFHCGIIKPVGKVIPNRCAVHGRKVKVGHGEKSDAEKKNPIDFDNHKEYS
jgi:hypothetical protein